MSEEPAAAPLPEQMPSQMIVWTSDATDGAQVRQVLSEGYRLNVIQDLEALATAPAVGNAPVLLLHLAPALALGRAMANDLPPQAALRAWREETRTLLALNRRDRRRTRLLDISEALAHPAAFRSHFNLAQGSGPEMALRNQQDDPFLLTLAQRLLLGDAEARVLAAELEAVSISLTGKPPVAPVDADAVYRDYRALRETEAEAGTLRRRTTELDTAKRNAEEQLQAERAEKAELQASRDDLQARIAEMDAARAALEDRAGKAEAGKAELDRRIGLLGAQAKTAQEEIETLAHRGQTLEKDAAQLPVLRRRLADREQSLQATDTLFRKLRAEQEVLAEELARTRNQLGESREKAEGLETELHRIFASRSFRLTGPLRRLRAALSGRGSS